MACKFFWDNFWKSGTITEASEHESFPSENTQHRDFNKAWRSSYGAGSGWGNFVIAAATNDKIDFEETGAAELTATLTPGTYDADTLAAEIETQLEAAGASDYTVTYSDSTNKFTLASDRAGGGGTFKILWDTGTNNATSVGTTIGFDVSEDDIDLASHEADYIRIHSLEWVREDLGSAQNVYGVMIRGHNFQAGADVYVQFSDDNWASIDDQQILTIQDDILVYEWDAPKNYRYVGIIIYDVDNPDGYVKMGTIFIGGQFQPTRTFLEDSQYTPADPSVLLQSEDGQYSSNQLSHFWIKQYSFIMESADKANFETMFAEVGTTKGLFFCEDDTAPLTTTDYVKFNSFQLQSLLHSTDVWRLDVEMEKLR